MKHSDRIFLVVVGMAWLVAMTLAALGYIQAADRAADTCDCRRFCAAYEDR